MLFKGTARRTAEDIAQEIDSLGGQLDAFTAKECASYYVKVLDDHLPRAVDAGVGLDHRVAEHDLGRGRVRLPPLMMFLIPARSSTG